MFWSTEATSLHSDQALAEKHVLNIVSEGACPMDHGKSWSWSQMPSTKNFQKKEKATIKG